MFPKTSLILASVLAAVSFSSGGSFLLSHGSCTLKFLLSGYAIDNFACWKDYTVKPRDTCISISQANQVPTYVNTLLIYVLRSYLTQRQPLCRYQLFTANPGVINPQCSNLRPGEVSPGQNNLFPSWYSTSFESFSRPGDLSWYCLCPKVYTVVSGDTCDKIANKVGISEKQLYAQNPHINPGCTNLELGEVKK